MSEKLKTYYKHLISNQVDELEGWYEEYESFTNDIQKIREVLQNSEHTISSPECYKDTSFKKEEKPYKSFARQLFANKGNGIASNGQSILKDEKFKIFMKSDEFKEIITNLIKYPSQPTNEKLVAFWLKTTGGNNPVLTNRALAACTLKVTSTVDVPKFDQVFSWLQKENIIDSYPEDKSTDWYNKNVFVTEQIAQALNGVEDVNPLWINIFYWLLWVYIAEPFSLKKQIVKYGAPGTGKTYVAKQTCKLQFKLWKSNFTNENPYTYDNLTEVVQFHPSYTYEDFMEGLRPIPDDENKAQLKLQNGVFKSFCIKAGRWEKDVYELKLDKRWGDIQIIDIENSRNLLTKEHWDYIFKVEDKTKKLKDLVPPFFMIIDEINRAELSRVFGELMICLEYRGVEGKVKTQYAQLNSEETGMLEINKEYQFFIPHNVYILATMNTIDRSVESFDFALRRRFKWEEVEPDTNLLRYHLRKHNKKWITLADSLEDLNAAIREEPILGKDYCIGHAYLWDLPYSQRLSPKAVKNLVWKDSIASLLEEYLRGTGKSELIKDYAKAFGV